MNNTEYQTEFDLQNRRSFIEQNKTDKIRIITKFLFLSSLNKYSDRRFST